MEAEEKVQSIVLCVGLAFSLSRRVVRGPWRCARLRPEGARASVRPRSRAPSRNADARGFPRGRGPVGSVWEAAALVGPLG